jgi:hypothetical protein
VLKNAMGSCRGACDDEEEEERLNILDMSLEGAGEGDENRSRGKPPAVMLSLFAEADVPALGKARPPSPDMPVSSSANASKDMRSAAFWLGLDLIY